MNVNITDQIRERAMISEVIGERLTLTQRGRTIKALCPFHNDTKPSLQVSDQKGLFKCFSCGMGGDVIKFVMEYDKVSFRVAVEKLASKYGLTVPAYFSAAANKERRYEDPHLDIKALNRFAAKVYHKYLLEHRQATKAREYLARRGIKKKAIKQFLLGYAPRNIDLLGQLLKREEFADRFHLKTLLASNLFKITVSKKTVSKETDTVSTGNTVNTGNTGNVVSAGSTASLTDKLGHDFFNHRIMFPICNERQEVLGFGGRALDNHPAKYMNSRESEWFLKHKILYGISEGYQLMMQHREVFVVEGYLDVLAMQALRLPAVAPLGTALTIDQLKKLKRYVKRVHFLLDGDAAGRKAAFQASSLAVALEMDGMVYTLPEKSDPFDFIMNNRGQLSAIETYFKDNCTNIYDYLLTTGRSSDQMAVLSPFAKKEALENIMPVYVALTDATIRNNFKAKIMKLFQTDPEQLAHTKHFQSILKMYAFKERTEGKQSHGQTATTIQSSSNQRSGENAIISGTVLPQQSPANARTELMASRKLIEEALVLFLARHPHFLKHAATLLYVPDFEDVKLRGIYKKLLHLKNDPKPLATHVLELFKDQSTIDYLLIHLMEENPHQQENNKEVKSKRPSHPEQELHQYFEELYCRFKIIQFRDQEIDLHFKAEMLAASNDEAGLRANQEQLLRASTQKRTLQDYLSRNQTFNLSTTAYHYK